jgi:spherulation-specific family 4 protein
LNRRSLPPLLLAAVVLLVGLEVGLIPFNPPPNREMNVLRIGIPLNADDPSAWSQAISKSPAVGMVVLNPFNGPGVSRNSEYASRSQDAQARGISIVGYVHTSYANGSVSLDSAKSWIDDYYNWYHVDGIIFDEANSTCNAHALNYYQSLFNYVKAKPGRDLVVLNPGQRTGECYALISDVIVTFENNYGNYTEKYVGASWTYNYPSSHFFHIVLNVPQDRMNEVISDAISRGAGWVYLTDLGNGSRNPYVALPSYFDSEVENVTLRNPLAPPSSVNYLPGVFLLGVITAATVASGAILLRGKEEGVERTPSSSREDFLHLLLGFEDYSPRPIDRIGVD